MKPLAFAKSAAKNLASIVGASKSNPTSIPTSTSIPIATTTSARGIAGAALKKKIGQFWTAQQRQMHPLHYAISYRASFKPEIPNFFIRKFLTQKKKETQQQEKRPKKSIVLDPFGGRGTTVMEANMLGFSAIYNDISPVAHFIARARRLIPKSLDNLQRRVAELHLEAPVTPTSREKNILSPFYHPKTLREILNLQKLVPKIRNAPEADPDLSIIILVALSRLHGHSSGFFSTYSFPQISILPTQQRKNNIARGVLHPEYKSVKICLLKKMKVFFLQDLPKGYESAAAKNQYFCQDIRTLHTQIPQCVDLVISSPPFMNVVDYEQDNWLKHWFLFPEHKSSAREYAEHDPQKSVQDSDEESRQNLHRSFFTDDPQKWQNFMKSALVSLGRIVRPNGLCVLEVGEVMVGGGGSKESLPLEKLLLAACKSAKSPNKKMYWYPETLLVNEQQFTKLAHCWQVQNNRLGTNSNRCLILRRAKF